MDSKENKINKKSVYQHFKKDNNKKIRLVILLVVLGYAFFFFSPLIFHQPSKANYTPYNIEYTIGRSSISVESWKYSKKQGLMEITLRINNISSEEVKYDYFVLCNFNEASKGKTNLKVEEVSKEINYAVVWIYNVPEDFNGCAMLITENGTDNNITIQTEKDRVEKTDNIRLLTVEERHIIKYKESIKSLKKEIDAEKKKIKKYNKDIKNYRELIEKTQKTELYQSEEEIEKTEGLISSYKVEIDDLRTLIAQSNKNIDENEKEISKYEALIKKISEKEGLVN